MSDRLFHQSSHFVDATPRAVFQAAVQGASPGDGSSFRNDGDITQPGAMIALRVISGIPGQVGCQTLARFNFGAVDLEMIETVVEKMTPHRLVLEQCPDRFVLFNRNERPLRASDVIPNDIQGLFDQAYNNPPTATRITMAFTPKDNGTEIAITTEADNLPRKGWFGRRIWQKNVATEAREIVLQICNRLQVQ